MTDRPFAVNINLFPTMRPFPIEQMIDVAHQEGVRILETSGRSPEPYMDRLKEGGRILIHKCAGVRDAVKALRNQTAQEILEMEARGASLKEVLPKLSGLKGKAAYEKGDVNGGVFPCGQAAGLVKELLLGKRGSGICPLQRLVAPPL